MLSLKPVAGRENDAKHVAKEQENRQLAPKDVAELKASGTQVAKDGNKAKDDGHQDAPKPAPPNKEESKQVAPPAPAGLNSK